MSHYSEFGVTDAQYYGICPEVYNQLEGTIFSPRVFADFVEAVSRFEGFSPRAYVPKGEKKTNRVTIGYGHTYVPGDVDDQTYNFDHGITHDDASVLLQHDLLKCMRLVQEELGFDEVNRLLDCQMMALIDFVFNCGIGNFRKSTLLKRIREHAHPSQVCIEFRRWNRSGGNVLLGLTRRCNWRCGLWCCEHDAL